jgi:hypothetical protein
LTQDPAIEAHRSENDARAGNVGSIGLQNHLLLRLLCIGRQVATESNAPSRRRFWQIALVVLVVLPLLPEIVVLGASAIADLSGCRVDDATTDTGGRPTGDTQVPPNPGAHATMFDRRPAIRSPQDAADQAGPGAGSAAKGFAPAAGPASGASSKACAIGPFPVSSIIRIALKAGLFVGDKFGSGVVIVWLALCYVSMTGGWTRFLSRLTLALFVSLIFAFVPYVGPMMSIANLENPLCQPNEASIGPCVMYGGAVGRVVHENIVLGREVVTGGPVAFGAFGLYALFLLIVRVATWARASRSLKD